MTVLDSTTGEEIPFPCELCKGESTLGHSTENRNMTSEEWCREFDVCAATIDWDKVYGRD